ncbi:hypothetical protein [Sphaerisporangium siamense]|uniref:hypothetical protein n=1 Tax=Sphaerisporangium siamense TaxID=795645 RepID=UPI0035A21B66
MPDDVVEHVAKQVQVPASELGFYEWSGSTIEYHHSQIRTHPRFSHPHDRGGARAAAGRRARRPASGTAQRSSAR